jgi:hypothetical protein
LRWRKAAEAVVSDISLRLVKHRGNLIQRIAFDKVKTECLSLILRKPAEDSLQIQRCELLFNCVAHTTDSGSRDFDCAIVEINPRVAVPRAQVAAS